MLVNQPCELLPLPDSHRYHPLSSDAAQSLSSPNTSLFWAKSKLTVGAKLVHISLSWAPTCGIGKDIPASCHWALLQHESAVVKRLAKFELSTLRAVLRT
eukprot:3769691-Amphidinium_carterae.1